MQERDGRWQIVDVFLQGTISEVATRKAEFTTVIRDKGFDALLNLLEQRIQDARGAS
jgi:phospholipid transport system substrate-binding protein